MGRPIGRPGQSLVNPLWGVINNTPSKNPRFHMADDKEPTPDSVDVKISFRVPQRMPTVYAHHMMVQPGEYEVLLSFFEVIPPPSFSNDPDALKKLQETGIVADCVARVTIANDRFPGFVKAMADILEVQGRGPDKEQAVQDDANDERDNPEG
jgi:hypothetical protein